jgi:hypothetical protein
MAKDDEDPSTFKPDPEFQRRLRKSMREAFEGLRKFQERMRATNPSVFTFMQPIDLEDDDPPQPIGAESIPESTSVESASESIGETGGKVLTTEMWVKKCVRGLKRGNKLPPADIEIKAFSEMIQEALVENLHGPNPEVNKEVQAKHIENHLRIWGLWPIEAIKLKD